MLEAELYTKNRTKVPVWTSCSSILYEKTYKKERERCMLRKFVRMRCSRRKFVRKNVQKGAGKVHEAEVCTKKLYKRVRMRCLRGKFVRKNVQKGAGKVHAAEVCTNEVLEAKFCGKTVKNQARRCPASAAYTIHRAKCELQQVFGSGIIEVLIMRRSTPRISFTLKGSRGFLFAWKG
ncbi:hypothetical protein D3P08_06470 [Paenibacillus nanensis]|uniref:Uncharacterized protein n=1 Tax=Paenibacillus nanensis TaxID=393251 RepID=A0A3A1UZH9_9BACL|nr:hypothetical protein D3P08_06470 [Paenibacillus nanensis]